MAEKLGTATEETLKYIADKYGVDTTKDVVDLPIGRFKDIPRLFGELGFKVGAEVGVFQGDYSKWLLRLIKGLKLYAIDSWVPYRGYKDFQSNTIVESYEKAKENTRGYDCELIKEWSDKAVERFKDGSLDFVFIDGNHQYEWVVQDISLWSKKVRKGGIVYGHDYDDYTDTKRWNEMSVIPAVDGWVKAHKIKPLFIISKNKNKCWMYVN